MLGLSYRDRQLLYDRINRRVDVMLELGLEREARELFESGMGGTAVQAIGYKELAGYFRGEQTLLEAGERLKMQTRRYAKRQLTWFGRDTRVQWLYVDDYPNKQALFEAAYAITGIQGVI
jgi:tRNA dimethylallyltransferase